MILKEGLSKYFIFSKLNEEQLVEAVKYSQYLVYKTKEQIFNIGDSLEYFYVIIKGSVSQYCTEHSYEMAKNRQKQSSDIILATAESTKQKLFRIKILNEGDYLGEQALLNTEQNHQSALQALADAPEVHLLAININMYKQYLQSASRNNLINDISTMSSNSIFDKWEFDMIRLLYFFSVKQQYYNGQTVFKEEDLSKAVFIILKGEFGIYKTFQQTDGKGIKQQGNKNHLSDEECSDGQHDEDEDTFRQRMDIKIKQTKSTSGEEDNDASFENEKEHVEEEQQLINAMAKTTDSFGQQTSYAVTQKSKKQQKKSMLDGSLNYIEDIEQTEPDLFKPSSKVLDTKQYKSQSQLSKGAEDENQITQSFAGKKLNKKNKPLLYHSKDDSATPKMVNNQPKNKLFQLYSLGMNQIFGEEDVMKKQKRSFNVKCNSYGGGILLVIRRNIFNLSLLAHSGSEIYLKKNLLLKEERFNQRVKMIQENITKYKNYFFENNADIGTPKNPLRAKRKLVEKDCINIDDFMKASKKQNVLEKSAQLNGLNKLEKQKKENAPLFAAEMITEKINTFSSPSLKKIDLFNFKNDICKVENPPTIHSIFQNELNKKVMKGQQGNTNAMTMSILGGSSNIAAIASNSLPNTARNSCTLTFKQQKEAKFISKPNQIFHRPKLSENNFLKVNNDQMVSLSQNSSGLMNSTQIRSSVHAQSQHSNINFDLPNSPIPPLLKKQASKSDPHIKLPPSIEKLNKMGEQGLLNHKQESHTHHNPILIEKELLKKELQLKQQIQKIEQANLPLGSPDKKMISMHSSVNNNDAGLKQGLSRKSKALQESSSGSLVYVPPMSSGSNVPKLNAETKPVKNTIFMETFNKGFFNNMKGIYYKNFSNQHGSLNTYTSIQESLAKHVLDPSMKQFLKQNPGILASKEKQNEFLRANQSQDKIPIKLNTNRAFLKSVPEFKQEDLQSDYIESDEYIRPLSSKQPQKSEVIKVNIFRTNQNTTSHYKFDINKIKEQNNKVSIISPDKKASPNKYKRTFSAMELNIPTHNNENYFDFNPNEFNQFEENSKNSPLKLHLQSITNQEIQNQPSMTNNHQADDSQKQQQLFQKAKIQYKKQNSLQPQLFNKTDATVSSSQNFDIKQNNYFQIPQSQTIPNSAIAFSTHHQNFFKASPLKSASNPYLKTQVVSSTLNNLSPELPKNKGTINRIFGSQSQNSLFDSTEKLSPSLNLQINLNPCSQEKQQETYQNHSNDLFRQKIENDKNLIKMTNLFITPSSSSRTSKKVLK